MHSSNPEDDTESLEDGNYQVIIAVVQATICGIIVILICANKHLSRCHKVTITALIVFELLVLVSGIGLYIGLRDKNTG